MPPASSRPPSCADVEICQAKARPTALRADFHWEELPEESISLKERRVEDAVCLKPARWLLLCRRTTLVQALLLSVHTQILSGGCSPFNCVDLLTLAEASRPGSTPTSAQHVQWSKSVIVDGKKVETTVYASGKSRWPQWPAALSPRCIVSVPRKGLLALKLVME